MTLVCQMQLYSFSVSLNIHSLHSINLFRKLVFDVITKNTFALGCDEQALKSHWIAKKITSFTGNCNWLLLKGVPLSLWYPQTSRSDRITISIQNSHDIRDSRLLHILFRNLLNLWTNTQRKSLCIWKVLWEALSRTRRDWKEWTRR